MAQTKEQFELPRVGQNNYVRCSIARGYDLVFTQPLGRTEIEIYQTESGIYAVYHPSFGTLDSECLFINIPSEDEVQILVSNSQERLEPIREFFGL